MKNSHALILTAFVFFLGTNSIRAQNGVKNYELKSPDGKISLLVEPGAKLQWSAQCNGQKVISPSSISLKLQSGEILGYNAVVTSAKTVAVNTQFNAINYKKAIVEDVYNQLTLTCKGGFGVIFRAYNDGVAYRFFTKKKDNLMIKNEEANFNFPGDPKTFVPYMRECRGNVNYVSSFENWYTEAKLSEYYADSLAFLPVLVDVGNNIKALILEADLEDYPGMFLNINENKNGFKAEFAPYPLEIAYGGFENINIIPTKRADYIANTIGTRNFPWRTVVISQQDIDLLNCDMVQKLASPSCLSDVTWIKPGQVAWDWWNDWNISHVDFRAGINTPTYKYYIDFASANKIPYIIMDAGWSDLMDLTKINPDISLQEIIDYGKQKNVGVILWASWAVILKQMDTAFPLYSKMGVKGFKIDFIDRDDQVAVASTYQIAEKAAANHLLVDYHGVYKPTGLQRTYPNVVGYEGVRGMENVKWANDDVPRYDVTLPFIRNVAGPMDYTSGAMRNANQYNFRYIHSAPMSQGTRCHQLAMYVIFEVPVQMLSDNPTIYMKEQECTDFITKIPCTFDESVALDGKVAEYVAIARKKGDTWFVGAMSNWDARDITLDFSFLGVGEFKAVVFKDGINADRDATDYKTEELSMTSNDTLTIKLSNGGGWAARIEKVN
jgi:alpha-glucosidase